MKNKLYIFGCSYSQLTSQITYNGYYDWHKGNTPPTWSELLAKKLDMELVNLAKGGYGNDAIFDTFCKVSDLISKDDIVIIGWSYLHRFRLARKDNIWEDLSTESNIAPVSIQTVKELGVNRDSILFEDELHNREKLIKLYAKYNGFNLFFWNAGFPFHNENGYLLQKLEKNREHDTFIDHVMRNGGNRIEDETNGDIVDNHLGDKGQIVQFELFYKEIKTKLKV